MDIENYTIEQFKLLKKQCENLQIKDKSFILQFENEILQMCNKVKLNEYKIKEIKETLIRLTNFKPIVSIKNNEDE